MFKKLVGAALAVFVAVQPIQAGERSVLGAGYLLVNDYFGDGFDRWRTGSAAASMAFGPEWTGQAPTNFGELLEVRFGGEIMAPYSLGRQRSWDRHYASSAFLGLHTRVQRRGIEASVGADVVAIGPMTRLNHIQSFIHRNADVQLPSQTVLDAQIQNTWRLRGVAEVGKTFTLARSVSVRPFAEVRTGDETLARVGFDATLGRFGARDLLSRDSVTGHRYSVVRDQEPGWSVVVGADTATVANSVYLPEVNGLKRSKMRTRARAGIHWRSQRHSLFYGVTWLGKEFTAQPKTQIVGAINYTYAF